MMAAARPRRALSEERDADPPTLLSREEEDADYAERWRAFNASDDEAPQRGTEPNRMTGSERRRARRAASVPGTDPSPAPQDPLPPSRRRPREDRFGSDWPSLVDAARSGAFVDAAPADATQAATAFRALYRHGAVELAACEVGSCVLTSDDADRIEALHRALELYVATRLDVFAGYPLVGPYVRYNLAAVAFAALSVMRIVVARRREPSAPVPTRDADARRLMRDECTLVDTRRSPVHAMSQSVLYDAVYALAARWNELRWSPTVERHLDALFERAAQLVTLRAGPDVMDGAVPTQRGAVDPADGCCASSSEFLADVSSMLWRMRASIAFRRRLAPGGVVLRDGSHVTTVDDHAAADEQLHAVCGVDLDACVRGMRAWLDGESLALQESRFREKMCASLRFMCLRPGDVERYTRAHNGVASLDATAVMDDVRAPQQAAWWALRMGRDGTGALLHAPAEPALRQWTTLKLFAGWCTGAMSLDWWPDNVLTDIDGHRYVEKLATRDAPAIVQHMGEFNVHYAEAVEPDHAHRGTRVHAHRPRRQPARVYRTVDADRAVACWVVLMVHRERCQLRVWGSKTRVLPELITLLATWTSRGSEDGRRQQAPVARESVPLPAGFGVPAPL